MSAKAALPQTIEATDTELIEVECKIASLQRRRDQLLVLRARYETEQKCARGERIISAQEVRRRLRGISRQGFDKLRKNPSREFPVPIYVDSDPGWNERAIDAWIKAQSEPSIR